MRDNPTHCNSSDRLSFRFSPVETTAYSSSNPLAHHHKYPWTASKKENEEQLRRLLWWTVNERNGKLWLFCLGNWRGMGIRNRNAATCYLAMRWPIQLQTNSSSSSGGRTMSRTGVEGNIFPSCQKFNSDINQGGRNFILYIFLLITIFYLPVLQVLCCLSSSVVGW